MSMRTPLIVISVAAAMLAACDQATSPIVAGLGGAATTPPGSVNNNAPPIVITPSQVQLLVGATFQFSTNAPAPLQNQVQWSSLQSTVVTVSPSGLATAVAVGTATITARFVFDTTRVATATVVVTGPTTMGTTGTAGGSGVP